MVTRIRSSKVHTCKPHWSSAVCVLCTVTHRHCPCSVLLCSKRKEYRERSKSHDPKALIPFQHYQARNDKCGMKSFGLPITEKKSNHFSCFRFFPRCMRRELGTLGIVCWVYPFLQSEAVVPSFCSKNAEKRPCLHDLVSYHDAVHVSPNSALMYLSVYLEMLY